MYKNEQAMVMVVVMRWSGLSQRLTEDCPELAATSDGEQQYLAHHLVRAGGFYARDTEAQVHAQAVDVTPATHEWH